MIKRKVGKLFFRFVAIQKARASGPWSCAWSCGRAAVLVVLGAPPVLYCCCVLRPFPEVHISSNQGHHLFKHSSALSLVTPPQPLQPRPKTTRRHTRRLLRMPSVLFGPIKTRRLTPPHGPETSGLALRDAAAVFVGRCSVPDTPCGLSWSDRMKMVSFLPSLTIMTSFHLICTI